MPQTKSHVPFFTFTIYLLYYLQGGSVIRLFHKELEAYLVAEGLFDDEITEDGINKQKKIILK